MNLAGEDIAQENMIQKSETNIIEVIKDNINKQKCLKVMKCILVFIFICVVSVIGFTIYRLKKPQNYISPVAKDSIEMQTAELFAGSDGAFVYKFITTDRKTPKDGKEENIRVRVTPEQKQRLVEYAERHYQSMSGVVC